MSGEWCVEREVCTQDRESIGCGVRGECVGCVCVGCVERGVWRGVSVGV